MLTYYTEGRKGSAEENTEPMHLLVKESGQQSLSRRGSTKENAIFLLHYDERQFFNDIH